MNRFRLAGPLLLFGVVGLAPAGAEPPDVTNAQDQSKALVRALGQEDFAGATRNFDEVMKKALPAEKLKEVWKSLTDKMGAFSKPDGIRSERVDKYDVVIVTCVFAKGSLDAKVVFGGDGRVTGLFFVPSKAPASYQPPAYVRPEAFRERELRVGTGDWSLPATLTIPLGDGPFPAVVLVHGSGPHDRDETILANKPFRDLAWGLASRGVAVLRYEKRTRAHAAKLAAAKETITPREEVIDDARAAVALLQTAEKVDARKVFLLGHSLGGMLAPRIGTGAANLAGVVILAGNTRPLEDVIVDQFTYLLSKDGLTDPAKQQLERIKEQAARVKRLTGASGVSSDQLPLGVPAAYWLDLRGYDPAATAREFARPLLILQGERDYQVTMDDFQGWKKQLGTRKDVTFKSYPHLNHLFMAGKGKATPQEYETAGHVDRAVVADIAAWIAANGRGVAP